MATLGALARLRRRRHNVSLDGLEPPAADASPEDQLIHRELAARLRQAIAALPEREGAVFALRCLEGLSLTEIAQSLGITYAAAATALSRARAKLEAVLAETAMEDQ
jgi:RNA polymerase sigma factor (sigma-70 family)